MQETFAEGMNWYMSTWTRLTLFSPHGFFIEPDGWNCVFETPKENVEKSYT